MFRIPETTEMINIITRGKTTEDVVNEASMQGHVRANVNGRRGFFVGESLHFNAPDEELEREFGERKKALAMVNKYESLEVFVKECERVMGIWSEESVTAQDGTEISSRWNLVNTGRSCDPGRAVNYLSRGTFTYWWNFAVAIVDKLEENRLLRVASEKIRESREIEEEERCSRIRREQRRRREEQYYQEQSRRRDEEYRVQQERFYKDQYFKGNTHRQRSPIRGRRRNEYY